MRVLWFSDIVPEVVSRRLGLPGSVGAGAWIENLRRALMSYTDLELGISVPTTRFFETFEIEGVCYFGLRRPEPKSKFMRLVRNWSYGQREESVLDQCHGVVGHFSPDIVHVHGTEGVYGLLARNLKVPVIISLQGLLTAYKRFYFCGITFSDLLRLFLSVHFLRGSGELHGYLRMVNKARREESILRSARWLIGRTEWDKTVAWSVNPKATYFHCDEIMRPQFGDQVWGPLKADSNTLYCTSSTMLFKGAETLLEALSVLRKGGLNKLRLKISGIPPGGDLWDFCQHRIRKYGLGGHVQFLGRIGPEEIVQHILEAGMFIYPSHIDNSPNSLVEAMLVGIPIIAANAGGIPSLVKDGRDGLLYDDKDSFSLAGRIKRLFEDRDTAIRLGKQARQTSINRNDRSEIAGRMMDIYKTVVRRQGILHAEGVSS